MKNQDVLVYCKEMLSNVSQIEHIQIRNIISRAYYFTYYECISHLEHRLNLNQMTSKGGVHAKEISRLLDPALDQQKKENAALLFTRINNLKKLRVRADYKLETTLSRSTAQYCVTEAEGIADQLSLL